MTRPEPAAESPPRENSPWLSSYRDLLVPGALVLDLGCGTGDDASELKGYGCRVVALDLAPERVQLAPSDVCRVAADMSHGLPFASETFDAVAASLSIHYFDTPTTDGVVCEIARVLRPTGLLLGRVNAVGDVNFGYGQGIEMESDLYRLPDGRLKRFFTTGVLERFLAPCFTVHGIQPRTILQHGLEKQTLECLARKR